MKPWLHLHYVKDSGFFFFFFDPLKNHYLH
jgi:hypothetical protein